MPLRILTDIVTFAAENSGPLLVAVGVSFCFNALVLTLLRLLLKPIFFASVFVQLALFMGVSYSTLSAKEYPSMIATIVVFVLWMGMVLSNWAGWMMALNIQQVAHALNTIAPPTLSFQHDHITDVSIYTR
jgi:hypothetical protein